MHEYFGHGGALAASLPGFESRSGQEELACAVAEALERGEHLLAEAGTGTGKSLAYLIPALASGQRVVVATATKALQQQLVAQDVPAAAAALGREVDAVLLKGRENYLCRRSLDGLSLLGGAAGALFRTEDDAETYDGLRDWIESTATGDRAELPFEPSQTLWAELAVGGDRCLGRRCPVRSTCFSEIVRERAADAELVVTNHALYLADAAVRLRRSSREGVVLPEHDAVVFDEAHRLEDAAAAWFGGRVSVAGVRRLVRDVERAARERGSVPPVRLLSDIERLGLSVIESVDPGRGRKRLREADVDPVVDTALSLAELLGRLADGLAGSSEDGDALARRSLGVARDLDTCMELDVDTVVWSEPGAVAWAPVDVAAPLREAIWDTGVAAILVSATLEPAFLKTRLGLEDASEIVLPSPFAFADQGLLYVPADLPEPRAPGYEERIVTEALELCRLSRGRALVLTSSYRMLDRLAPALAEALPYTVLRQGEAPRERLLEQFRQEVDSVLCATATFWQGIDVPGESLSLLVIDKLPFSPPDDPLVQARCERIEAEGGDAFAAYSIPTAVLQLRQGVGRLVRGHGDRGVVAILDRRLRSRFYGRRFLAALPPFRLVADRAEIGRFFSAGGAGDA